MAPGVMRPEMDMLLQTNAFDLVMDAVVVVNQDGELVYINPQAEEMFGYPAEEILGSAVERLLPFRLWEAHRDHRQDFMSRPRRRTMGADRDLLARHKDGREIPVYVSMSPRETNGELEVICIVRDASWQSISPEGVRLQGAALEAAANAIVITDRAGVIQWVNPAFSQLTGYSAAEAFGENPRILNSGYHSPDFFAEMWLTILEGRVWHGTVYNRRKQGQLYVEEMTITPVRSAGGEIEHFIAIKQDVTERVAQEEKLRELYVQEREQRSLAEALHQVSTALSASLDVEEVLDSLLSQISRVVPYDSGSVLLLDGDLVRVARSRGYEHYGEEVAENVADFTMGLETTPNLLQMVKTGQPSIISDTADFEGWVDHEHLGHIRSWAGAPILARGEVIGFLSLDKATPDFYQPEHIRLLAAFAGQAALAIQNARFYEAERRRREALEALQDTVADISSELELTSLLNAILVRAYGLVGAAGGELALYEENSQELVIVTSNYLGQDYTGIRLQLGEGAMGQVALSRKPLIVEDYFDWEAHSTQYGEVPIHTVMAAPLMAGKRLVGVISVADPGLETSFTAGDLQLLSLFAQQAAIAVENARLFEAAHLRAGEAETLRQAGAAVVASLEQPEAIERILKELSRVVPFDSASVQLIRDGHLEVVGGSGWPNPDDVIGMRFPIPGDNPNTVVIQTRRPHILAEADFRSIPLSEHIQSWLGVPLILREKVIGMLAVDSMTPGHFTENHARLVSAFADQVALALENARMYEGERRRVEELQVLNAIAVASAEATDEDILIERATRVVGDILFPDVFGVMLLDPAGGLLRPHQSYRLPEGVSRDRVFRLGEGVTGRVARDGAPILAPNVQDVADYIAWVDGIRSKLCVPLRIGRRVIGVINAESVRLDAFSPADERLLVTLAGQLTTGIERVRLYRAALRAAERRAVLFQASQEIGASLEPEEIYKAIHRAARKLMPSDVFVIARVDSKSGTIQAPYLFEKDQRFPARQIPMDRGLSGHVISTGESLRTGDYEETHARVVDAEVFGEDQDETTSVLAVPMRLGSEVIGMLSTQAFRRDAFTEEDQEALESMAIQAAIALNNADLYVASRRQVMELRVLNEVSDALARATSEDALIDEVTRLIGDALYPDNFGILLVDAKKGVLRVHPSYRGLLDQIRGSTLEFEVPLGQGVSGQVAQRGEPWRISDVAQEPAYLEVDARMRSELCVPIKVGERVVGVINAESARPDAFTLADEQLLLTFAGQLATALEKMRLFQEVQHLAITDPLTGQFNRRHFFDEAEREFQRARRYARPLSVVMLDLDRFKRVNDSYGHAVGDQVLRVVAETCRQQLRTIDLLARYGGEEFIVLLPESSAEDARHVAERLCWSIAALRVESDAGPVQVTISVGAAGLTASCADLDELLIRADRALYDAKQAGRNRVSVYSD